MSSPNDGEPRCPQERPYWHQLASREKANAEHLSERVNREVAGRSIPIWEKCRHTAAIVS
jgi:hypothetical protein